MIEILGKQDCQPCQELKMVLDMNGHDYNFYDATVRGDKRAVEMKVDMAGMGVRSIPAVWVDGQFVGAGDKMAEKIGDYL